MFGRGVFLKVKNFHSIVIVVRLHVSKFSRVLKKLTAYTVRHDFLIFDRSNFARASLSCDFFRLCKAHLPQLSHFFDNRIIARR
jgi:hypothetical protein